MAKIISFKKNPLEVIRKKYPSSHEKYLADFRNILNDRTQYPYSGFLLGYLAAGLVDYPEQNEIYERLLLHVFKSPDASLMQRMIDCILKGEDPACIHR